MNSQTSTPIALELASALLVPAAAFGFLRVFDDSSAITPLVGAAILSTAVAVLFRRVRVPLSASAALSLLFLSALIINRFAPGTSRLGLIPTSATAEQFGLLIDELVVNFQELRTPVPALDAFVATAMIGIWIMAFLTDWGAMRLRLAFEPVLPAALLFIFAALLGANTNQILVTVIFATAVAIWAVVQRSVNLAARNTWLTNDRKRGSLSMARAGAVLVAVALLAGLVVGPRLPGAQAEEIISLRDRGEPTRVVVSPFVNLEARLVDQTDTELFTVASEQPAYWRLAGLDTYENDIWKVAGNFSPEDGDLPGQRQLGGQRDEVVQDFSISALSAIWLPAAFAPSAINDATESVTWNAETSSLTVANDVPSSNGVAYTLTSLVPRFTSTELRAAPEVPPPADIAERYLPLPAVPDVVRQEALRVTAGADTRYDKMLALQQYFREFDYSVDLSPRVGDPLEQFLSERVGFCQQFAGTFAVMARLLGVPARLAIGFTWGDPVDATEDGRTIYRVTGRQTHAWPEVWFEGIGWVAFEPTPGRGAPSAVEYTQVPARQDAIMQETPDGPVVTTTIPQTAAPGVNDEPLFPEDPLGGGDLSIETETGGGIPVGTLLRILAVLAVVGAYVGGLPAWHWYRRERRRSAASTPADGVETAWAEVSESLEMGYGLTRRPSETRREYARRLSSDMRVPREPMTGLANAATVARYHPNGLTPADAERASDHARAIEASVNERISLFNRWQRMIDPRRLFKPTARVTVARTAVLPASHLDASMNGHRPADKIDELV